MDISEAKKFIQNKIIADKLTEQIRDVIKTKKWQKQDMKEGFKESFKPLIKSQDKISESIKDQQKATIEQLEANQLALTEGLRSNRLALTQGLKTISAIKGPDQDSSDTDEWDSAEDKDEDEGEKISDLINKQGKLKAKIELDKTKLENIEETLHKKRQKEREKEAITLDLEQMFDTNELVLIDNLSYERPSKLSRKSKDDIKSLIKDLNDDIKNFRGKIGAASRNKDEEKKNDLTKKQKILIKYKDVATNFLKSRESFTGTGIYFNNPHQLLDRLELLSGSIIAGNNGVLPEFSQIVHLLNKMGAISKKQLNNLLKNYILIK